ncbi:MAG: ribonucleotide-diphosphate reductase subunit beta [Rhizobiales bacterium]|nr:ribonucleotide-diphosphate reductase subunit beta [Hyphomicrobiales bacterium]
MSVVQAIRASMKVMPGDARLEITRQPRRDFPVWHFAMVNDASRNETIERSIASMDLKGKTVVEIGSGTGLIALLFAKYGADRVVTCEMNANLVDVARRVIASTEYADRIHIINESSTVAIERGLLPLLPDVIFTETLDCGVVGEGFMSIAEDIRKLAGPETVVMPRLITQTAALIHCESLANLNRAGTACGFDLRLLNEYATGNYFPAHTELHHHSLLCEPVKQRDYAYLDCPKPEIHKVRVQRAGAVHGVLSWFAADFGTAVVSNAPYSGSHWHQAFHPLPEEVHVEEDDEVSMQIDDDGFAWVTRER